MKILFAAGGTGGHINPALAAAGDIRERFPDAEILFVGTKDKMESKLVPQAGFDFATIDIDGFYRQLTIENLKRNFKTLFKVLRASGQAKKLIRAFSPDVVVGFGGYVSGPVLRMAAKLGVPTAIHEQNAYPGITNKALASRVDRVMLTSEKAAQYLQPKNPPVITGLPVRGELLKANRSVARAELGVRDDQKLVLSMGGSLGAETINRAMVQLIADHAQDKTLTWESSEPEIADVDEQGEVHMFRTGTVTITATAKSGVTSSYTLQIVDQQPVPEDLVLDTDTIELAAGEHAKITYTVVPSGAKSENVRFTSDDDGVASVDSNGVVFGERAGMAAITVTLRYLDEDGEFVTIERTCLVDVYGEEEEPDEPDEREEQDCGPGQHDLVKRNAVSPTCLENGIREYWACRVCGKLFADAEGFDEISAGETIIEALGHDWGDWKVVEKATAGREGLEERVCGRCGEKEQRSVPWVSSGRDDTDTGDKSNPGLWILLAAAALAGIGGVIVLRRRK